MFVFPDSRPDYFPIQISLNSWKNELNQLSSISEGNILTLSEKGFTVAGKVYGLWQKIKGFLGFNDETNEFSISGRILKLLYVGVSQGYMQQCPGQIEALEKNIDQGCFRVHQAVKTAIQNLESAAIRNQLVRFYHENQDALAPSFWNRFTEKKIDLVSEPAFGDTHLAIARDLEGNDPLQALTHYRIAAQLYNPDERTFLSRLTAAFVNFSKSKNFASEVAEICLFLAQRHYSQHHFREAFQLFQQAAENRDLAPDEQVLWMNAAAHAGQWGVAKKLADQIPSYFQAPLACCQLAEASFYAKRYDDAARFFERAIQNGANLSPGQKELQFVALTQLRQFIDAKTLASELAERAPFYGMVGKAHLCIAEQAFEAGRYDEAVIFFSRAPELDPRQKALWMRAAVNTGRLDIAKKLSNQLSSDMQAPDACLQLAEVAFHEKRYAEALAFLERASQNGATLSSHHKIHWMIAAAMTQEYEAAEELSFQVPNLQAADPARKLVGASYLLLAEKKAQSNDYKEMERFFDLAHKNGIEFTSRHWSLWFIAAGKSGQRERAVWISESLPNPIPEKELRKEVANAYLTLAEGQYDQKKFDVAEKNFQFALQNEGELSPRQLMLWLIASSKCGHFNIVEELSKYISEIALSDLKREIGEAMLSLAQKKWESKQVAASERFFDLAAQADVEMSPYQKALWMIASVETEAFERAEQLISEIQTFNPSEALRAPLAEAIIRLAEHLMDKREVAQLDGGFFSYFWSETPGQVLREDRKILAHYQRAFEISPSEDQKVAELLARSFIPFAARFSVPDAELGGIYLTLAERMFSFHAFAEGEKYFHLASQNRIALNKEQTARWMISAAKVQNHARVLNLSRQVAESSLKGTLKTEVQDVFLLQADRSYEGEEFEQTDLFYQLARKIEAPLTLTQKGYWIIASAKMGRPHVAEEFSHEDFEPLPPALKREIGNVFLMQGEKESSLENYKIADRFFQLADQYRVALSKEQQIRWFYAAVEAANGKTAERLADEIEECKSDEPLKDLYLSAMIRLADQYAAPKETLYSYLPSWFGGQDSIALGQKAAKFYYRTLLALDLKDPLRMQILTKLSQTAHYLKAEEPAMLLPFNSSNYLERIYSHLILIKQQNSLASPTHRKSIEYFTDEIWELYKDGKSDECLPLIEEALTGIGDIQNNYLSIRRAFFTRSPQEIQSNVPDLLDGSGRLVFNLGAELYFLKGEILRKKEGDTQRVLDSYEQAVNLAPGNPFGAGALFMEDNQTGGSRSSHIDAYRRLALEWGAVTHRV